MSWSCAVQTRDKKQHRTATCRKCKEELGHPLVTKATYYKQINVKDQWEQGSVLFGRIGTLQNYDGDGNEKVKKRSIRFHKQNNNSARALSSLVNFFAVPAKLRRENKWPNLSFLERRYILLYRSKLRKRYSFFSLSLISELLKERTSWDNREKVWKNASFPDVYTGVGVVKSYGSQNKFGDCMKSLNNNRSCTYLKVEITKNHEHSNGL